MNSFAAESCKHTPEEGAMEKARGPEGKMGVESPENKKPAADAAEPLPTLGEQGFGLVTEVANTECRCGRICALAHYCQQHKMWLPPATKEMLMAESDRQMKTCQNIWQKRIEDSGAVFQDAQAYLEWVASMKEAEARAAEEEQQRLQKKAARKAAKKEEAEFNFANKQWAKALKREGKAAWKAFNKEEGGAKGPNWIDWHDCPSQKEVPEKAQKEIGGPATYKMKDGKQVATVVEKVLPPRFTLKQKSLPKPIEWSKNIMLPTPKFLVGSIVSKQVPVRPVSYDASIFGEEIAGHSNPDLLCTGCEAGPVKHGSVDLLCIECTIHRAREQAHEANEQLREIKIKKQNDFARVVAMGPREKRAAGLEPIPTAAQWLFRNKREWDEKIRALKEEDRRQTAERQAAINHKRMLERRNMLEKGTIAPMGQWITTKKGDKKASWSQDDLVKHAKTAMHAAGKTPEGEINFPAFRKYLWSIRPKTPSEAFKDVEKPERKEVTWRQVKDEMPKLGLDQYGKFTVPSSQLAKHIAELNTFWNDTCPPGKKVATGPFFKVQTAGRWRALYREMTNSYYDFCVKFEQENYRNRMRYYKEQLKDVRANFPQHKQFVGIVEGMVRSWTKKTEKKKATKAEKKAEGLKRLEGARALWKARADYNRFAHLSIDDIAVYNIDDDCCAELPNTRFGFMYSRPVRQHEEELCTWYDWRNEKRHQQWCKEKKIATKRLAGIKKEARLQASMSKGWQLGTSTFVSREKVKTYNWQTMFDRKTHQRVDAIFRKPAVMKRQKIQNIIKHFQQLVSQCKTDKDVSNALRFLKHKCPSLYNTYENKVKNEKNNKFEKLERVNNSPSSQQSCDGAPPHKGFEGNTDIQLENLPPGKTGSLQDDKDTSIAPGSVPRDRTIKLSRRQLKQQRKQQFRKLKNNNTADDVITVSDQKLTEEETFETIDHCNMKQVKKLSNRKFQKMRKQQRLRKLKQSLIDFLATEEEKIQPLNKEIEYKGVKSNRKNKKPEKLPGTRGERSYAKLLREVYVENAELDTTKLIQEARKNNVRKKDLKKLKKQQAVKFEKWYAKANSSTKSWSLRRIFTLVFIFMMLCIGNSMAISPNQVSLDYMSNQKNAAGSVLRIDQMQRMCRMEKIGTDVIYACGRDYSNMVDPKCKVPGMTFTGADIAFDEEGCILRTGNNLAGVRSDKHKQVKDLSVYYSTRIDQVYNTATKFGCGLTFYKPVPDSFFESMAESTDAYAMCEFRKWAGHIDSIVRQSLKKTDCGAVIWNNEREPSFSSKCYKFSNISPLNLENIANGIKNPPIIQKIDEHITIKPSFNVKSDAVIYATPVVETPFTDLVQSKNFDFFEHKSHTGPTITVEKHTTVHIVTRLTIDHWITSTATITQDCTTTPNSDAIKQAAIDMLGTCSLNLKNSQATLSDVEVEHEMKPWEIRAFIRAQDRAHRNPQFLVNAHYLKFASINKYTLEYYVGKPDSSLRVWCSIQKSELMPSYYPMDRETQFCHKGPVETNFAVLDFECNRCWQMEHVCHVQTKLVQKGAKMTQEFWVNCILQDDVEGTRGRSKRAIPDFITSSEGTLGEKAREAEDWINNHFQKYLYSKSANWLFFFVAMVFLWSKVGVIPTILIVLCWYAMFAEGVHIVNKDLMRDEIAVQSIPNSQLCWFRVPIMANLNPGFNVFFTRTGHCDREPFISYVNKDWFGNYYKEDQVYVLSRDGVCLTMKPTEYAKMAEKDIIDRCESRVTADWAAHWAAVAQNDENVGGGKQRQTTTTTTTTTTKAPPHHQHAHVRNEIYAAVNDINRENKPDAKYLLNKNSKQASEVGKSTLSKWWNNFRDGSYFGFDSIYDQLIGKYFRGTLVDDAKYRNKKVVDNVYTTLSSMKHLMAVLALTFIGFMYAGPAGAMLMAFFGVFMAQSLLAFLPGMIDYMIAIIVFSFMFKASKSLTLAFIFFFFILWVRPVSGESCTNAVTGTLIGRRIEQNGRVENVSDGTLTMQPGTCLFWQTVNENHATTKHVLTLNKLETAFAIEDAYETPAEVGVDWCKAYKCGGQSSFNVDCAAWAGEMNEKLAPLFWYHYIENEEGHGQYVVRGPCMFGTWTTLMKAFYFKNNKMCKVQKVIQSGTVTASFEYNDGSTISKKDVVLKIGEVSHFNDLTFKLNTAKTGFAPKTIIRCEGKVFWMNQDITLPAETPFRQLPNGEWDVEWIMRMVNCDNIVGADWDHWTCWTHIKPILMAIPTVGLYEVKSNDTSTNGKIMHDIIEKKTTSVADMNINLRVPGELRESEICELEKLEKISDFASSLSTKHQATMTVTVKHVPCVIELEALKNSYCIVDSVQLPTVDLKQTIQLEADCVSHGKMKLNYQHLEIEFDVQAKTLWNYVHDWTQLVMGHNSRWQIDAHAFNLFSIITNPLTTVTNFLQGVGFNLIWMLVVFYILLKVNTLFAVVFAVFMYGSYSGFHVMGQEIGDGNNSNVDYRDNDRAFKLCSLGLVSIITALCFYIKKEQVRLNSNKSTKIVKTSLWTDVNDYPQWFMGLYAFAYKNFYGLVEQCQARWTAGLQSFRNLFATLTSTISFYVVCSYASNEVLYDGDVWWALVGVSLIGYYALDIFSIVLKDILADFILCMACFQYGLTPMILWFRVIDGIMSFRDHMKFTTMAKTEFFSNINFLVNTLGNSLYVISVFSLLQFTYGHYWTAIVLASFVLLCREFNITIQGTSVLYCLHTIMPVSNQKYLDVVTNNPNILNLNDPDFTIKSIGLTKHTQTDDIDFCVTHNGKSGLFDKGTYITTSLIKGRQNNRTCLCGYMYYGTGDLLSDTICNIYCNLYELHLVRCDINVLNSLYSKCMNRYKIDNLNNVETVPNVVFTYEQVADSKQKARERLAEMKEKMGIPLSEDMSGYIESKDTPIKIDHSERLVSTAYCTLDWTDPDCSQIKCDYRTFEFCNECNQDGANAMQVWKDAIGDGKCFAHSLASFMKNPQLRNGHDLLAIIRQQITSLDMEEECADLVKTIDDRGRFFDNEAIIDLLQLYRIEVCIHILNEDGRTNVVRYARNVPRHTFHLQLFRQHYQPMVNRKWLVMQKNITHDQLTIQANIKAMEDQDKLDYLINSMIDRAETIPIAARVDYSFSEDMAADVGIKKYFEEGVNLPVQLPQIFVVSDNSRVGFAFAYRGVTYTSYHVTHGHNLIIPVYEFGKFTKKMFVPSGRDQMTDAVFYGGQPQLKKPKENEWYYVTNPSSQMTIIFKFTRTIKVEDREYFAFERMVRVNHEDKSVVRTTNYYGFYGWSGLPICDEHGIPVGVYGSIKMIGTDETAYNMTSGLAYKLPYIDWAERLHAINAATTQQIHLIHAQTGSGKSTKFPIVVATHLLNTKGHGLVLVLNPLRATNVANKEYVDSMISQTPQSGKIQVEYRIGGVNSIGNLETMQKIASKKVVIMYCSYGVFWNMVGKVTCDYLLLDEAHVTTPEVQGIIDWISKIVDENIVSTVFNPKDYGRIVCMTATPKTSTASGDRNISEFAVPPPKIGNERRYVKLTDDLYFDTAEAHAGRKHLIFLPTKKMCDNAVKQLKQHEKLSRYPIWSYYSGHSNGMDNLARFNCSTNGILVCTNAIETGLTPVGCTDVWDSMLENVVAHDPDQGCIMYQRAIDKKTMLQRRGRCGRTTQISNYWFPRGKKNQLPELNELDRTVRFKVAAYYKMIMIGEKEIPEKYISEYDALEGMFKQMPTTLWQHLNHACIDPYTLWKLSDEMVTNGISTRTWHPEDIRIAFADALKDKHVTMGSLRRLFPTSEDIERNKIGCYALKVTLEDVQNNSLLPVVAGFMSGFVVLWAAFEMLGQYCRYYKVTEVFFFSRESYADLNYNVCWDLVEGYRKDQLQPQDKLDMDPHLMLEHRLFRFFSPTQRLIKHGMPPGTLGAVNTGMKKIISLTAAIAITGVMTIKTTDVVEVQENGPFGYIPFDAYNLSLDKIIKLCELATTGSSSYFQKSILDTPIHERHVSTDDTAVVLHGDTPNSVQDNSVDAFVIAHWNSLIASVATYSPAAAKALTAMAGIGVASTGAIAIGWDQLTKNFGPMGAMTIGTLVVACLASPNMIMATTVTGLVTYAVKVTCLGTGKFDNGLKIQATPLALGGSLFLGSLFATMKSVDYAVIEAAQSATANHLGYRMGSNANIIVSMKALYSVMRYMTICWQNKDFDSADMTGILANISTAVTSLSLLNVTQTIIVIVASCLLTMLWSFTKSNRKLVRSLCATVIRNNDIWSSVQDDWDMMIEEAILIALCVASYVVVPDSGITFAITSGWYIVEQMLRGKDITGSMIFENCEKAFYDSAGVNMFIGFGSIILSMTKFFVSNDTDKLQFESAAAPPTPINVQNNSFMQKSVLMSLFLNIKAWMPEMPSIPELKLHSYNGMGQNCLNFCARIGRTIIAGFAKMWSWICEFFSWVKSFFFAAENISNISVGIEGDMYDIPEVVGAAESYVSFALNPFGTVSSLRACARMTAGLLKNRKSNPLSYALLKISALPLSMYNKAQVFVYHVIDAKAFDFGDIKAIMARVMEDKTLATRLDVPRNDTGDFVCKQMCMLGSPCLTNQGLTYFILCDVIPNAPAIVAFRLLHGILTVFVLANPIQHFVNDITAAFTQVISEGLECQLSLLELSDLEKNVLRNEFWVRNIVHDDMKETPTTVCAKSWAALTSIAGAVSNATQLAMLRGSGISQEVQNSFLDRIKNLEDKEKRTSIIDIPEDKVEDFVNNLNFPKEGESYRLVHKRLNDYMQPTAGITAIAFDDVQHAQMKQLESDYGKTWPFSRDYFQTLDVDHGRYISNMADIEKNEQECKFEILFSDDIKYDNSPVMFILPYRSKKAPDCFGEIITIAKQSVIHKTESPTGNKYTVWKSQNSSKHFVRLGRSHFHRLTWDENTPDRISDREEFLMVGASFTGTIIFLVFKIKEFQSWLCAEGSATIYVIGNVIGNGTDTWDSKDVPTCARHVCELKPPLMTWGRTGVPNEYKDDNRKEGKDFLRKLLKYYDSDAMSELCLKNAAINVGDKNPVKFINQYDTTVKLQQNWFSKTVSAVSNAASSLVSSIAGKSEAEEEDHFEDAKEALSDCEMPQTDEKETTKPGKEESIKTSKESIDQISKTVAETSLKQKNLNIQLAADKKKLEQTVKKSKVDRQDVSKKSESLKTEDVDKAINNAKIKLPNEQGNTKEDVKDSPPEQLISVKDVLKTYKNTPLNNVVLWKALTYNEKLKITYVPEKVCNKNGEILPRYAYNYKKLALPNFGKFEDFNMEAFEQAVGIANEHMLEHGYLNTEQRSLLITNMGNYIRKGGDKLQKPVFMHKSAFRSMQHRVHTDRIIMSDGTTMRVRPDIAKNLGPKQSEVPRQQKKNKVKKQTLPKVTSRTFVSTNSTGITVEEQVNSVSKVNEQADYKYKEWQRVNAYRAGKDMVILPMPVFFLLCWPEAQMKDSDNTHLLARCVEMRSASKYDLIDEVKIAGLIYNESHNLRANVIKKCIFRYEQVAAEYIAAYFVNSCETFIESLGGEPMFLPTTPAETPELEVEQTEQEIELDERDLIDSTSMTESTTTIVGTEEEYDEETQNEINETIAAVGELTEEERELFSTPELRTPEEPLPSSSPLLDVVPEGVPETQPDQPQEETEVKHVQNNSKVTGFSRFISESYRMFTNAFDAAANYEQKVQKDQDKHFDKFLEHAMEIKPRATFVKERQQTEMYVRDAISIQMSRVVPHHNKIMSVTPREFSHVRQRPVVDSIYQLQNDVVNVCSRNVLEQKPGKPLSPSQKMAIQSKHCGNWNPAQVPQMPLKGYYVLSELDRQCNLGFRVYEDGDTIGEEDNLFGVTSRQNMSGKRILDYTPGRGGSLAYISTSCNKSFITAYQEEDDEFKIAPAAMVCDKTNYVTLLDNKSDLMQISEKFDFIINDSADHANRIFKNKSSVAIRRWVESILTTIPMLQNFDHNQYVYSITDCEQQIFWLPTLMFKKIKIVKPYGLPNSKILTYVVCSGGFSEYAGTIIDLLADIFYNNASWEESADRVSQFCRDNNLTLAVDNMRDMVTNEWNKELKRQITYLKKTIKRYWKPYGNLTYPRISDQTMEYKLTTNVKHLSSEKESDDLRRAFEPHYVELSGCEQKIEVIDGVRKRRLEPRLNRLHPIANEHGLKLYSADRVNIFEHQRVLATYRKQDRLTTDKTVLSSTIAQLARDIFGWHPTNSPIAQVSKDRVKVLESIQTRIDRPPAYIQPEVVKELIECGETIIQRPDKLLAPWSFEQAQAAINKQGAAGMLDKWGNMEQCLLDPDTKGKCEECLQKMLRGEDCTEYYGTVHNKVESKASEELHPKPRLISYFGAIARIVDWMVFGPYVEYHYKQKKIFKHTSSGTPIFEMGDVLWRAFNSYNDEPIVVPTYNKITGNMSSKPENFTARGVTGDASKWDHSLGPDAQCIEAYFVASCYQPQYHDLICNIYEHIIWPILFTRLGFCFTTTGHRCSGWILTWSNSLLNVIMHNRAWKKAIGLPMNYGNLDAFVKYYCDGDDNVHFLHKDTLSGKNIPESLNLPMAYRYKNKKYVYNENALIDRLNMAMKECNITIRHGTDDGYQVHYNFNTVDFLSHTFTPVFIVSEKENTGVCPLLQRTQRMYYQPDDNGVFAKQHIIKFMPYRELDHLLGKLSFTLKVASSRNTTKCSIEAKKRYDETGETLFGGQTSKGMMVEEGVMFEASKAASYLMMYPHLTTMRVICLSTLAILGFPGDNKFFNTWRTMAKIGKIGWYHECANLLDIPNNKFTSIIGALQSMYGATITSLDDISLVSNEQHEASLRQQIENVVKAYEDGYRKENFYLYKEFKQYLEQESKFSKFSSHVNLIHLGMRKTLRLCKVNGSDELPYPAYLTLWKPMGKIAEKYFSMNNGMEYDYLRNIREMYARDTIDHSWQWEFGIDVIPQKLYDTYKYLTETKRAETQTTGKRKVGTHKVPKKYRSAMSTLPQQLSVDPESKYFGKSKIGDMLDYLNERLGGVIKKTTPKPLSEQRPKIAENKFGGNQIRTIQYNGCETNREFSRKVCASQINRACDATSVNDEQQPGHVDAAYLNRFSEAGPRLDESRERYFNKYREEIDEEKPRANRRTVCVTRKRTQNRNESSTGTINKIIYVIAFVWTMILLLPTLLFKKRIDYDLVKPIKKQEISWVPTPTNIKKRIFIYICDAVRNLVE